MEDEESGEADAEGADGKVEDGNGEAATAKVGEEKTGEGGGKGEGAVVLRESGFSMTLKDYDNTAYEEQLFYFNTKQRVALYPHAVQGEGIDHCYDCRAEVQILTSYLKQVVGMASPTPEEKAAVATRVAEISKEVSRSITKNRTLASDNSDPSTRQKGIKKSQWINNKPAYKNAHEIRAKQKANGELPQLMIGGQGGPLMIGGGTAAPMAALAMEGGERGEVAGDAKGNAVGPIQKLSGTTISHPLVDRIRGLLQRQSNTYALPESLLFREKQTPTSSGWARCVAPDGVVLYINTQKKVCTTDAPSVGGWTVRQADTKTGKDESSEFPSYSYEDTLSGKISVDVPEPIKEDR